MVAPDIVDLEAGRSGVDDHSTGAAASGPVLDDDTSEARASKDSCRKSTASSTASTEGASGTPSPSSTACTDNGRRKTCSFSTSCRSLSPVQSNRVSSVTQLTTTIDELSKRVEKKRLWVLDNSKFFLTMLVALGHTLPHSRTWFNSLYHPSTMTFMMPTYIVISGYTSSTDLKTARKVDGVLKVAAIYIIIQFLYLALVRALAHWQIHTGFAALTYSAGAAFGYTVEKGNCEACWKYQDWLVPFGHLWYLLDLVVWRVLIIFWWRLKYPLATAWIGSAVFSCCKIYRVMNYWSLDLERSLISFPLFVLGAVAKERKWTLWEHKWSRIVGLLAVFAFVWMPGGFSALKAGEFTPLSVQPDGLDPFQGETWHFAGQLDSWNSIVGDDIRGRFLKTMVRMGVSVVHACSVWGVLHIMPREEWSVITSFGSRSLANYLFHLLNGWLLALIGCYGMKGHPESAPWWGDLVVVLTLAPMSLFWMSPFVWKLFKLVLDPPIHLMLKKQEA